MAELESQDQQPSREDMIACVDALDAALLPCLPIVELKAPVPDFDESITEIEAPAMELQVTDDCLPPSHQSNVEKHAKDFMEAAKRLKQYFVCLQREDKPTEAETLRKEISALEEELKTKNELIQKQGKLIQEWKKELKYQLDKHNSELEMV